MIITSKPRQSHVSAQISGVSDESPKGRTAGAPARGRVDRVGSWSLSAADGAYAMVPAWTTGAAWFDALMDALATPEGEGHRRAVKVAPDTLLRVARAEWLSADVATGRGITTAHETLALQLGMCKRTVQRCRELLEVLGFAVTVEVGRYLTTAEREAAHQVHGGRQVRAASVRALTLPKRKSVENVHLPFPRKGSSISPVIKNSPRRARAQKEAAPRLQPGSKKANLKPHRRPRPIGIQQLAAGLVNLLPWLTRDTHIGKVCDLLTRSGIDPARWTATGLKAEVDRFCRSAGVTVIDPGKQKDPLAYFAWMLRPAIDKTAETARERGLREHAEAIERRRQWASDVAAERARADTLTDKDFARIRAASDAQIRAQNIARRATR